MRIASAVVIEWDQDQSLNDIFGINEVCWTTAVSDGAQMFCTHWGIAAFYQDKLKTVRGQTIINTKLKKKNHMQQFTCYLQIHSLWNGGLSDMHTAWIWFPNTSQQKQAKKNNE